MGFYDAEYARKLQAKTDWYRRLERNRPFVQLIHNFALRGGVVLDVGTGVSDIPAQLSEAGFRVWAIDVNESNNALFRSKSSSSTMFITGDIFTHVFDRTFDAIIMKDFLEHFSHSEIRRLLKRANTLLNSRGLLLVSCPVRTPVSLLLRTWQRWRRPGFPGIDDTGDETHQQWFTEKALRRELALLRGYQVMHVQYLLYGINNFPQRLIMPLYQLQQRLYQAQRLKKLSLAIQRIIGFRVLIALRKH